MIRPAEKHLPYVRVGSKLCLSNLTFEDVSFERFEVGPCTDRAPDTRVIENVKLVNASIEHSFGIFLGAAVSNFEIRDVQFHELEIPSEVAMNGVTVVGGSPSSKIRICESWDSDITDFERGRIDAANAALKATLGYILDVSEWRGQELDVRGVDTSKVIIDPHRHVRIDASRFSDELWPTIATDGSLEKKPGESWQMLVWYARRTKNSQAVFSLPVGSGKRAQLLKKQHDQLLEMGALSVD